MPTLTKTKSRKKSSAKQPTKLVAMVAYAATTTKVEQQIEIKFAFEREKAHQVFVWFAAKHAGIDVTKLVSLIFYADRDHLVRYGRPIVGGKYVALGHGPASFEVLNELELNNGSAWRRVKAGERNTVQALGTVNEAVLSESDFEVLKLVHERYGNIDPIRLRKMTCAEPEYKKNFEEDTVFVPNIPYEDMFLSIPEDKRSMLDIVRENNEAYAALEEEDA